MVTGWQYIVCPIVESGPGPCEDEIGQQNRL